MFCPASLVGYPITLRVVTLLWTRPFHLSVNNMIKRASLGVVCRRRRHRLSPILLL